MGHSDRPQKFLKSFTSLGFHGRFLRSAKFLLKNRAILRNARGLGNAESTQRLRRYANQRNDAEFVRLESEVRSSIRLSYRHCGILDFRFEIFDFRLTKPSASTPKSKISNPKSELTYRPKNVSNTASSGLGITWALTRSPLAVAACAPASTAARTEPTSPRTKVVT